MKLFETRLKSLKRTRRCSVFWARRARNLRFSSGVTLVPHRGDHSELPFVLKRRQWGQQCEIISARLSYVTAASGERRIYCNVEGICCCQSARKARDNHRRTIMRIGNGMLIVGYQPLHRALTERCSLQITKSKSRMPRRQPVYYPQHYAIPNQILSDDLNFSVFLLPCTNKECIATCVYETS